MRYDDKRLIYFQGVANHGKGAHGVATKAASPETSHPDGYRKAGMPSGKPRLRKKKAA
tara:strand:+ start:199 stop:372 length:174 start_codon:yes stop_codon:yes gene_type:complete